MSEKKSGSDNPPAKKPGRPAPDRVSKGQPKGPLTGSGAPKRDKPPPSTGDLGPNKKS